MSYFKLFDLPEQFDIDLQKLKAQYQVLQRMTHPDRFTTASDQEKRLYLQKNSEVNQGLSVLTSPVTRGEHLLTLRGFALADEPHTMGDTEFLMQQMSLREQLADAETESDFEQLETELEALTDSYIQTIRTSLEQNSADGNQQAATALTKLKFLVKLASESDSRRDQVLDI